MTQDYMKDKAKLEEEYGKPLYQWNEVVILFGMGENRTKMYCIENNIKSVHRGYYDKETIDKHKAKQLKGLMNEAKYH
jgi:hypothetical protein